LDGEGSARPDHQGEDNTQTHHWQRLWQLTEYNKLQTASGFECTLQATLHIDTIIVCRSNARGQTPTQIVAITTVLNGIGYTVNEDDDDDDDDDDNSNDNDDNSNATDGINATYWHWDCSCCIQIV